MKTLELLQALNKEEKLELELQLQHHKRPYLHLLLQAILSVKESAEAEKEELFQQVFQEPYQKKKDYLLRNELRLLNKELEQFLAKKQLLATELQAPKFQLHLLRSLLHRQQYALFEKEWRRALKKAQQQQQSQQLAQLYDLYADFIFEWAELKPENYKDLQQKLQEGLLQSQWAGAQQYLQLERKLAVTERTIKALLPDYEMQLPAYSIPDGTAPALVKFLANYNQSYLLSGSQKIAALQQALGYFAEVPQAERYRHLAVIAWTNLALEYNFASDYKKADAAYLQVLPYLKEEKSLGRRLGVLFNYCSNAVLVDKFEEVVNVYTEWEQDIVQHPKFYYRFKYICCMALLFLKQPQAAFELIAQDNISQRPEQDYYYVRHIYFIIYYQQEDWDSAARELTNTFQGIRYKAPNEEAIIAQTKWLQQLLRLRTQAGSKKEKKQSALQLQQQIQQAWQESPRLNGLIVRWVESELLRFGSVKR